jgi:putative inorganic carbon (hco3(-)) transporter
MGMFFVCLSLILIFFSPNEVLPALVRYRPLMLTLIIGTVVSLPAYAMRPVRSLQQPQYLLVFGLWAAIVISHLTHLWIRTAAYSIMEFGPCVVLFLLICMNAHTPGRIKIIGATLIFCGVILSIQGALAYYTGWRANDLLLYGPDDPRAWLQNRIRGYGILRDPNDLSQFLLIAIALLGLFWKANDVLNKLVLFIPGAVLIFGVYLTFSRGAMLGLCAVLYVMVYRKLGNFVSSAGVFLTFIALRLLQFTGSREISIDQGRMVAWGAGVGALLHRPLFGIGYGHFTDINEITAHNSFVLCFAELGLFGYFFWLALIVTTVLGLWGIVKVPPVDQRDADVARCARAVQAAMAGFIVTGWFLSRTYQETFYVVLALACAVLQLRKDVIPSTATLFSRWAPRTIVCEVASVVVVYISIRLRGVF